MSPIQMKKSRFGSRAERVTINTPTDPYECIHIEEQEKMRTLGWLAQNRLEVDGESARFSLFGRKLLHGVRVSISGNANRVDGAQNLYDTRPGGEVTFSFRERRIGRRTQITIKHVPPQAE